jgi:hypothetical protein
MTETTPHPLRRRRPFAAVRPALLTTLAAGAACAVAASVAAGTAGLWAALVATVLVIAFFASGSLPIALAKYVPPSAMAGVGLLIMTYTLRLALIFVALGAVAGADGIDQRWLGLSLVACTLAYTLVHAVVLFRENGRRGDGPARAGEPE